MGRYVLGVAGGSGAPYMRRVLESLLAAGHEVHAVFSEAGRKVCDLEVGLKLTGDPVADEARIAEWLGGAQGPEGATGPFSAAERAGASEWNTTPTRTGATGRGTVRVYALDDFEAPIASGSFKTNGMVVVPCSVGALGRIAHGTGSNLLERAADVTVKERRPLILVPRETPLSLIHLRNMVAAAEAGIEILPAMPGFYHNPRSVQDIVDSVAGRVLDRLGIDAPFLKRWTGPVPPEFAAWEDR